MLRTVARLLTVSALAAIQTPVAGELPKPLHPRWKPVADEVYLQEVGAQIVTDRPVLSVAVLGEVAYAGTAEGVHRIEGSRSVPAGGPRAEIRRLRVLNDNLWAVTGKGLWRRGKDGAWSRVAAGRFVDACSHLGRVIVAARDRLYAVERGKLEALHDGPSRLEIQGVASYSETLYVRHAGRLGFLHDRRFDYDDVEDWGHLPRASSTRDILSLGSALLVPTDKGLAVLRGAAWRMITGSEGLCYEDTTCVAPGFDRDYWVGTRRGAVRVVGGKFHYFGHERWLPHDEVNAIACGDKVAYIATDGGLGIIRYEPYTLEKKAAWYKRWIEEWGMKRLGFIHTLQRRADGTYVRFLSDNDGGWACHYLDALCFEWAVTGDTAVRDEAINVFKALKWLEEITPIPGFPARAIYAVGEDAIKATTGSAGRPAEWNPTQDGKWEWKGDTSSDEIASHYYTATLFYELVAEGELRDVVAEHIERITDHIVENGWVLRDLDGKPTVWGRWEPAFVLSPHHTDERGLNSCQALSIIATAQHMVGADKYSRAKDQLLEWRYPENVLRTKIVFPHYTHFDDRLAFLGYYPLLLYETDSKLRGTYVRSLQRSWEVKRFENQTWFNYVYGALTGNDCQNTEAVQHLRDYPLDCTDYRFTNSHRHDLHVPAGYTNYVTDTKAMGPREQGVRRWDRDPLELDGGGSHRILDPSSYLDAYWMGRYFGMIGPPTTSDPRLLRVGRRQKQRGAAPYRGPPRPKVF